jgi:hypothetical protein
MATTTVSTLAGPWLAQVVRPSGTVEIGLHFGADGSVFIVSGGHGAGSWWARRGRFVYRIKEPVIDEQGRYAGHVDIRQTGTIDGDTFASSGESCVYDADGAIERRLTVNITAVRRAVILGSC